MWHVASRIQAPNYGETTEIIVKCQGNAWLSTCADLCQLIQRHWPWCVHWMCARVCVCSWCVQARPKMMLIRRNRIGLVTVFLWNRLCDLFIIALFMMQCMKCNRDLAQSRTLATSSDCALLWINRASATQFCGMRPISIGENWHFPSACTPDEARHGMCPCNSCTPNRHTR